MTPAETAYDLLKTLGLEGTCPVPLQKILEHIGYRAQLFPVSEKTRNLSCGINPKDKVVFANAGDPAAEQRYAFGHAIAHAVLHPGRSVVDRRQNLHHTVEDPLDEWEANQFADELLMETHAFLQKWEELRGDIGRLTNHLALPRDRVLVRVYQLGLK
jgi:Zn-dependent peptidase ImmA (M78 family)